MEFGASGSTMNWFRGITGFRRVGFDCRLTELVGGCSSKSPSFEMDVDRVFEAIDWSFVFISEFNEDYILIKERRLRANLDLNNN